MERGAQDKEMAPLLIELGFIFETGEAEIR